MYKVLKLLVFVLVSFSSSLEVARADANCDTSLIGIYELVGERAERCSSLTTFQLRVRAASERLPSALVFDEIVKGYGVIESKELVSLKDGPDKSKAHSVANTDAMQFITYSSRIISQCYALEQTYRSALSKSAEAKVKHALLTTQYTVYKESDGKEYLRVSGFQQMDISSPESLVSWECKYEKKSSEVYLKHYSDGMGAPEELKFPETLL